ncbi:type III toxin-antitoxin system ToxN/AbiQ family toxin [Aliivibrio logei]|uniref:type III toxin-antitoxin system ToxN/AbiQ family toxin n=1 Tax=Aliivibrio logei TaxID=688 RepID=UPI00039D7F5B|nr:type III toxin-antitoxin system ToxN/AbiQ family toxin [Aliivibrio logei]
MKFYIVSDDYIQYLQKVDNKVRENKTTRPYIGVVLEINNNQFLAPLTSYKEKHDRIPEQSPLIFKMYDLDDTKVSLGMVQLNNMIPICESEVSLLDLSSQSDDYQVLVNKQQKFLRKNKSELKKKALKLYKIIAGGHAKRLVEMSCDFKSLETAKAAFEPAEQRKPTQEKLEELENAFK